MDNGEQKKIETEYIDFFAAIPNCQECRARVERLLTDMGCWVEVQLGYPTDYGTHVYLLYPKGSDKYDYWEKAEQAKARLVRYCYRTL